MAPKLGSCRALLLLLLTGGGAPALAGTTADDYSGCAGTVALRTFNETPGTYLARIPLLIAGDRMVLANGTYPNGLPLSDLHGQPGNCIVIEGPAGGPAAVFTGRNCCNTVAINRSSYLVLRNLELNGQGLAGDGVKAENNGQPDAAAHHITIENFLIYGHAGNQQIVGISTKCPAWNWVIRRNRITGAGTGIYLGNSDGTAEHVSSLVEHNLIRDTTGYNMQIKHQVGRDTGLGIPASGVTIIRHNVFSKAQGAAGGDDARPNLLVGHWPLSGAGSEDHYEIYGNFFYQNPTEYLFQGEGNLALYDNLFVNTAGGAVNVQPHEDLPRAIRVFHNTVVASGTGIRVTGGDPGFTQRVVGNASFAVTPFSGSGATLADNVSGTQAAAGTMLNNPDGVISGVTDRLDLYPLPGQLLGAAVDWTGLAVYSDWNRDFNGATHGGLRRGAYAGEGVNPGWLLALDRKPELAGNQLLADGFEGGTTTAWASTVQ